MYIEKHIIICNSFRKDYKKRIGINNLCHAKLIYDIEYRKWLFNGPHSEMCINIHQIQQSNGNLYN